MQITPELNAVLISSVVGIMGALVTWMVAWLRVKTKQLNEMAATTRRMADANHELLEKNTTIMKNVERQTDGLNIKMAKIAAAAAFTRGRVQGRTEGESDDPYEDLYKLEEEVSKIIGADHAKMKPGSTK